ncbi:MAG: hypothetical protein CMK07_10315 [Ponticaulis sp.]|nr:hypothetical protein [Ponticaulis sp.]
MKAIVHAGMDKTGSSSIQRTLHTLNMPNHLYAPWKTAHHDTLLPLLFREDPENFPLFKVEGRTRKELVAERDLWRDKLKEAISTSDKSEIIFSAEMLSSGGNEEIVQGLAEFLKETCSETKTVMYVRSPVSFMQSSFQQKIKTGRISELNVDRLWPNYRKTISVLDKHFGQENTHIFKFDPASFPDQNVVKDFGQRLGIRIPDKKIVRVNDGLSLEGVALAFLQRKFGSGVHTGFAGARLRNKQFTDALNEIGEGRVVFSEDLTRPVLEKHKDMLDWLEKRVGEPMTETPKEGDVVISEERDLIRLARRNARPLNELLEKVLSEQDDLSSKSISAEAVSTVMSKRGNEIATLVEKLELLKALT